MASWDELEGVQAPADALLHQLGYRFIRDEDDGPVLVKHLEAALRRLNPWIDDDTTALAIRALIDVSATSLLAANQQAHTLLVFGLVIAGRVVRYLDLSAPLNNDAAFSRDYEIDGNRLDMVVFLNGIPVVVIELASPAIDPSLAATCEQLQDHQRQLRLFQTVQIMIAANGQAAVQSTVGAPAHPWRTWESCHPRTLDQLKSEIGRIPTPQDVLLAGMLRLETLVDLIENFIVFDTSGREPAKLLATYSQYEEVSLTLAHVHRRSGPARSGLLVRPPQTGRSMTMLFLAKKLLRSTDRPVAVVVVTLLKMLEHQLAMRFQVFGLPHVVRPQSAVHLRELLRQPDHLVMITTAHKFRGDSADEPEIVHRGDNVFVICEEAHGAGSEGVVSRIRRALPNAAILAFTTAPERRSARAVGEVIHLYTLSQAVDDGTVLPVYYDPRRREPDDADEAARREAIGRDLVEHFRCIVQPGGFKALLLVHTVEAAHAYTDVLRHLGGDVATITAAVAPDSLAELVDRFRQPRDPLSILVVTVAMSAHVQTSTAQVLYVDAPVPEERIIDLVASVNRRAPGKDIALVVDYRGIQGAGALRPMRALVPQLTAEHAALTSFFRSADRDNTDTCLRLLQPVAARRAFDLAFRRLARTVHLAGPALAGMRVIVDLEWLFRLRRAAALRFHDHLLAEELGFKLPSVTDAGPTEAADAGAEEVERDLGLDDVAKALYDVLTSAGVSTRTGRRGLASHLEQELRKLALVDWPRRLDLQRRMRQMAKHVLVDARVPSSAIEPLVESLMAAARARLAH